MNPLLLGFLTIIVGPIVIRLFYGVFIQPTEAVLRGYLAKKRSRWKQAWYVRAFVGAMRGNADVTDTAIRTVVVVSFFSLLATVGMYLASSASRTADRSAELSATIDKDILDLQDREIAAAKSRQRVLDLQNRVAATGKGDQEYARPTFDEELKDAAIDTEDRLRDIATLKKQMQDSKEGIAKNQRTAASLKVEAYAMTALFLTIAAVLTFIWMPVKVMTRVFTFEISRFMLRIQSIAKPEEVSRLARLEVRVKDAATLREFVELAVNIARAHDVEALALRFDLWDAFSRSPGGPAPAQ